jgi:hypothetical protein
VYGLLRALCARGSMILSFAVAILLVSVVQGSILRSYLPHVSVVMR